MDPRFGTHVPIGPRLCLLLRPQRYFTAVIASFMSNPNGLIINGVPVIFPVRECVAARLPELLFRDIPGLQCRQMQQVKRRFIGAVVGSAGIPIITEDSHVLQ